MEGQVSRTAAEVYEELFVPALFAQFATHVADAAQLAPGERVLDVACGTGVLAREAARRVAPGGTVTGVDPNEGMLAVARRRAPAIDWHREVAESLPWDDGAFDAVVSQFGLMFFGDRVAALREMRRVSRDRLVVAVWDAVARSPGYAALAALLEEQLGAATAAELRAPFLGGEEVLRPMFAAAGMPAIDARTVEGTARFPSLATWLRTEIRGWTLAERIDDEQLDALERAAASALRRFVSPSGEVAFSVTALVLTSRR